jgi:hypothetical protein
VKPAAAVFEPFRPLFLGGFVAKAGRGRHLAASMRMLNRFGRQTLIKNA